MTYSEAILASLLRSLVIAGVGTPLAWMVFLGLDQSPGRLRPWFWLLVLLPFLTPSLMTGYCYRDTALALVHRPWAGELIYSLVIAGQTIPVGVLIYQFAPPPVVSDSARHVARLTRRRRPSNWRNPVGWAGLARHVVPCAAIFGLVFQEADLASLMQAATWSEWLFTHHAGGLPVGTSARLAAVPMLLQVPFLILLAVWVCRPRDLQERLKRTQPISKGAWLLSINWVMIALLAVCILPSIQLFRGARQGWPTLFDQRSTWEELQDSLLLAVTCGGLVFWMASQALNTARRRFSKVPNANWAIPPLIAVCGVGLMGNLSLGLILAAIFQTPLLQWAYDTPIPLIVGESLYVLPRTLILMAGASTLIDSSAHHCLGMVRPQSSGRTSHWRELQWRESGIVLFIVFLCGCGWVYLEVMLPTLLAMPGMAPVSLILYNSLHYGRISALGAKLVLALIVPLVAAALFLGVRRLSFRRS
ncbi:MAG: hypothetical protein KDA80_16230 [Planctomycetaceae bacterium]|nr:hypothetical protein [Planctomycetaceae bacterium]